MSNAGDNYITKLWKNPGWTSGLTNRHVRRMMLGAGELLLCHSLIPTNGDAEVMNHAPLCNYAKAGKSQIPAHTAVMMATSQYGTTL
jgi:hypothetical protein